MTNPTTPPIDALRECPFCGGAAQWRPDHNHSTGWIVECMTKPSCPIHDREIWGLTKFAAATAWNTRATPPDHIAGAGKLIRDDA